jgi:hypothetical protein
LQPGVAMESVATRSNQKSVAARKIRSHQDKNNLEIIGVRSQMPYSPSWGY